MMIKSDPLWAYRPDPRDLGLGWRSFSHHCGDTLVVFPPVGSRIDITPQPHRGRKGRDSPGVARSGPAFFFLCKGSRLAWGSLSSDRLTGLNSSHQEWEQAP